MINNSLKEIQALEHNVNECRQYVENLKYTEVEINALAIENMVLDMKKTLARNTLINISNIIEKTVEDGSKNFEGMNKQFNVHSLHLGKKDDVYLVTREVLGVDLVDKKFILSSEETFINFKTVNRIF